VRIHLPYSLPPLRFSFDLETQILNGQETAAKEERLHERTATIREVSQADPKTGFSDVDSDSVTVVRGSPQEGSLQTTPLFLICARGVPLLKVAHAISERL
jgi:hypothetical protein